MKRHAGLATLLLTAALGACSTTAPPTSTDRSSTVDHPSPVATSAARLPVEGTWQTDPISQATIVATLRAAGLDRYVEPFQATDGQPTSRVLTLKLAGGQWTLLRADDGKAPGVIDLGTYTVDDNRLVYAPRSGGADAYLFSVADNKLTLRFMDTTEPDYAGLPNEVPQRAFYTSAPFHRVNT